MPTAYELPFCACGQYNYMGEGTRTAGPQKGRRSWGGGRACCAHVKLLPPGGASRQLWQ